MGKVSWEDLKKKGFRRFTGIGEGSGAIGNATEMAPGETITPLTDHVVGKMPYPTLTRRIQFYIDHPLYLEMGEALPVHKDPPTAGGDHPLVLSGGHTRWSIHANWRDDRLLMRQQRGEPTMFINPDDARSRGVSDGDRVRVYNDIASFEIMAKITPAMRPGMLMIYHAWENYQFKDAQSFQNLMPTPINPVDLAGDYFHLRQGILVRQPNQTDRDTRVNVARV